MLGRVRVDPDKGITGTILKYELQDAEFERERSWLVELLREEFNSNRREENQEQKEYRVECGCCFDTEEPVRVFHLTQKKKRLFFLSSSLVQYSVQMGTGSVKDAYRNWPKPKLCEGT